ncbi:diacylglycerol/lipid kinase family protein [Euzebya tangerina]|uniref:diacylglycerol/lipid kinase family protein n=1 Tax=Euzebya tangerina TaxID=591198 RepID=UPI0013C2C63C|nr:YegS/Rv2252/BmrU family lipid kinase [Euzebya tangerina]
MSHPFGTLHLIVNPRAGRGAVKRTIPQLTRQLDAEGLDHRVHTTTRAGHATELARQIVDDGGRYVLAVGGDGTVNEVVNGLLDQDGRARAADVVLAVVAAGSGCDLVRTYGLDLPIERLVRRHLTTTDSVGMDVGVATFTDPATGEETTRFFANIAQVGWGAQVVRRAARLPRFTGRVRYLLAAWSAIRAVNRQEVALELQRTTATVPLVELVVANGQFFGGGMKVAPRALPDDGLFNVLAFTGTRSQVFTLTPKLYAGEHLPDPHIAEWQSATAAVAPETPMLVEADGEFLGRTPARFSLLSTPLQLKI